MKFRENLLKSQLYNTSFSLIRSRQNFQAPETPIFPTSTQKTGSSWCQCYKSFLVRNLRIFVLVNNVFLLQAFQLSLMFVIRSAGYPRVEHLKGDTLGQVPALLANIRLSWKGLPGTNTLTYFELS